MQIVHILLKLCYELKTKMKMACPVEGFVHVRLRQIFDLCVLTVNSPSWPFLLFLRPAINLRIMNPRLNITVRSSNPPAIQVFYTSSK